MTIFTDIMALRKEQKTDEAYAMARKALDGNADDLYLKRAMAWCVYDNAKRNAQYVNRSRFMECLTEIDALGLPETEVMVFDQLLWCVRALVLDAVAADVQDQGFYDGLIEAVRKFHVTRPGEAYSALMSAVLKTRGFWNGFADFCRWWDFCNFMDRDFEKVSVADGERMMSLAERCYIAYAKAVISAGDLEWADSLVGMLESVSSAHPRYEYIPYYQAKALILLGRSNEAMDLLRRFARAKGSQFWVWELMGDASDNDSYRLCCYCKALSCRSKEDMLVSLREKAACLFHKMGYLPEAKYEVIKAVSTRIHNGWRISPALQALSSMEWFSATREADGNAGFYMAHCGDLANTGARGNGKPKAKGEPFEGKIKVADGGFGFVRCDGKTIFVPKPLLDKSGIENGAAVSGQCVKAMDLKKQKEGWRATALAVANG